VHREQEKGEGGPSALSDCVTAARELTGRASGQEWRGPMPYRMSGELNV